ncbi:MAG: PIN domain-containing protein [Alphaproteobacteria bacterium]|nr:PIN domain-containing protein [Alphaproteobacteria bacterium]
MLRAVIDTNVLFEGLTKVGTCSAVVDAWVARGFVPCVSTTLALEYEEVLTGKLGPGKRERAAGALQALLKRAEWVPIYRRVRPVSPDPDDDFVLECAFNARAVVVTRNLKDLKVGEEVLGLDVWTPDQFIHELKR